MAGNGSIAPLFVVPAEAITQAGRMPLARSAATAARNASISMRKFSSVGTLRSALPPRPSRFIAFKWQL